MAYAAPRPALAHGGERTSGRGLFAGHPGGTPGLDGTGQGGQRKPVARAHALPAWLAWARSKCHTRHGPLPGEHLAGPAWSILLTTALPFAVLLRLDPAEPAGGGGGCWLNRPSSS